MALLLDIEIDACLSFNYDMDSTYGSSSKKDFQVRSTITDKGKSDMNMEETVIMKWRKCKPSKNQVVFPNMN